MPLDCVYPAFQVQVVLDALDWLGVVDRGVYVVCLVIVGNCFVKNWPTELCEVLHIVVISIYIL